AWTEDVLKTCFAHPSNPASHGNMDGLSLHYYVHPGGWDKKGSATQFDTATWYKTLERADYMDELITRHGAIMDQYDPDKKIGMMVDEWGCWFDVEPGTNPGFLYQQNTMRDALVAGHTLNIFNRHCDRVKMACIAQMVNVLQSVILTEGPKMVLTPTYHVFHMYKNHQDAELLDSFIEGNGLVGEGECQVPHVSESVSVDAQGYVNVTLSNLSVSEDMPMEISFNELNPSSVEASILTGAMNAHNTFEDPECVKECQFIDFKAEDGKIVFTIPACSVISFRVK
ncbi:MAG: alpha-N-arabinofuranosidase, partial [Lachnospiraceae bacterium]|nr:alpha-N-arabinofuranosidase [Lachnospiraceae bacterium]